MTPLVPQCWVLEVWQAPSWQQPFGQLAGVQTQVPFWHSKPAGHATQVAPPVPQNALVFPWRQVSDWPPATAGASQQPAQLRAVEPRVPSRDSRPAAGRLTQVTPPVPQAW